ncbi:hypothetical protein VK92_01950 [Burkholderia sp. LK4]|nr:hypothetical protein VL00_26905 [Burkholderia cepacia]KMN62515.1 hypothetical protein VK92_01950 [Burkholderia sp. LK4]
MWDIDVNDFRRLGSEHMKAVEESQAEIDPSKLTLGQILKALKPGHIVAIATAFGAMLGGAYLYGRYLAEATDAVKLAGITAENGRCQAELSGAKQQVAVLTQSNAQLIGSANAENVEIGTLRQRLFDVSAASTGQKNCDFIHAQIKDAEDAIGRLNSPDVFSGGGNPDAEARIKALDGRIAAYQAQLGTCGSSMSTVGSAR